MRIFAIITTILVFLTFIPVLFTCESPANPWDKSNAKVSLILKSSAGRASDSAITDTAGNTDTIGLVLYLALNIDSTRLEVKNGTTIEKSVLCTEKIHTIDTVYYPITFAGPGARTVTATGYVTGELSPFASATIYVIARPQPNRKPNLTITGARTVTAGDTVKLYVSATDPDSGQTVTITAAKLPAKAAFSTDTLRWATTPTDIGTDTAIFIARDNGTPIALADTDTVAIIVSATPVTDKTPPVMKRITPPKDSLITGSPSSQITVSCRDESGIASVKCSLVSDTFPVAKSNDTLYSTTVTGLRQSVWNDIRFIAIDSAPAANRCTLNVYIKYDNDTAKPTMTRIDPVKDSVSTNASSYTIKISCTDSSGVASVNALLGSQTFTGTKTGNTWTIPITGLTINTVNQVIVTATDSSLKANSSSQNFYIKYDPTMLDTIGPTILFKSGPSSGSTVANAAIEIIDSVIDPNGIDSVYWTRNGGPKKIMPSVTGMAGQYSLKDTLNEGKFDTLTVTAVDKSSRHNPSTQAIILRYIKPPTITTQPVSQAACSGSQVIFSITATGTAPLSYQWRTVATNPTNISGAIFPRCTLNNVSATTILSCVVSNQGSTGATSNLCTLTVNSTSSKPTAAANPPSICSGSSSTLSISAGTLGTGAAWKWYTDKTGTALSSSTVAPTVPTWYYVRGEGICGNSPWDSIQIAMNTISTTPTAAATNPTVALGSSTTINVSAGTLGTGASWKWYSGSCGGTAAGSGPSITVTPNSTTTYYVRAEGGCQNTACASVTVAVIVPPASAPTLVSPKTDSNGIQSTPTLAWNTVTGAASYSLQVATNNAFNNPVINLTGLSATTKDVSLSGSTRYYWRVCGTNQGGQGPWSTDSFTTVILWTAKNTGLVSNLIVGTIVPTSGNLYLGTNNGVYFSSDNGDTWIQLAYGPTGNIDKIAANGAIVVTATSDGISRSLDNGNNWSLVLPIDSISSISGLAINGTTIYATSMNGGFYYSTDAGLHWTHKANMPFFTTLSVDASSGKVWAGIYDGMTGTGKLYFSSNNGATWDSTGSFGSVVSIAIANGFVYAADENGIYFFNGSSWTYGQGSPTYNTSLAGNGTKIIAGFISSTNSGVYFSVNGGKNWVSTSPINGTGIVAISSSYIFASSLHGVVRSPLP